MPNTQATHQNASGVVPTNGAMRALHTPTPWLIHECRANNDGDFLIQSNYDGGFFVATVRNRSDIAQTPNSKEEAKANAELIVKAVNTYEQAQADKAELVAVLTQIVNAGGVMEPSTVFTKARAVLARHAGAGKA